jgi:hypothetical protein
MNRGIPVDAIIIDTVGVTIIDTTTIIIIIAYA